MPISAGRPALRVEYFEQTGLAELRVELRRSTRASARQANEER